jgi:hypothetical protein
MQNHTHTHRLQSSLIHQNKVTMRPYLDDAICKITHTQITIIIDTSEQGYNVAISSWWDMQNHTHTHRSCSQVVDLPARGHRTSSISADGSETWFLAWLKRASILQWEHKASWTCTFGLQEPSATGGRKHGKIMIIEHRMKDCSSWKQWSLDVGWNCSSWCQEVMGYLPQTRLRERSMSQEFFWLLC